MTVLVTTGQIGVLQIHAWKVRARTAGSGTIFRIYVAIGVSLLRIVAVWETGLPSGTMGPKGLTAVRHKTLGGWNLKDIGTPISAGHEVW